MSEVSKPHRVPNVYGAANSTNEQSVDSLPAFQATFEITVIAKDHAAALNWAAEWLERFCDDEATLEGGLAHLPKQPVEFFDA